MFTQVLLIIGIVLLGLILRELIAIMSKLETQDPSGHTLWRNQLLLEKIELSTKFDGAKEASYEYDKSGRIKEKVLHFVGKPSIVQEFNDGTPSLKFFTGYREDRYDSGSIKQKVLYLDGYPVNIIKYDENGNQVYKKDCREEGFIMVDKEYKELTIQEYKII